MKKAQEKRGSILSSRCTRKENPGGGQKSKGRKKNRTREGKKGGNHKAFVPNFCRLRTQAEELKVNDPFNAKRLSAERDDGDRLIKWKGIGLRGSNLASPSYPGEGIRKVLVDSSKNAPSRSKGQRESKQGVRSKGAG